MLKDGASFLHCKREVWVLKEITKLHVDSFLINCDFMLIEFDTIKHPSPQEYYITYIFHPDRIIYGIEV